MRERRGMTWALTRTLPAWAATKRHDECHAEVPSRRDLNCYDAINLYSEAADVYSGGVWPPGCGRWNLEPLIEILPNWSGPHDNPAEVRLGWGSQYVILLPIRS